MFKHLLTKAALAVPVAALAVFGITTAASASPGPSSGPPSSHSVVGGHFKASYPTNDTFWSCSGVRITNKGSGTFDSETCDVTGVSASDLAAYPAGTYSGNPTGVAPYSVFNPGTEWQSDFNGQIASSWTMSLSYDATGGADGLATVEIVAQY